MRPCAGEIEGEKVGVRQARHFGPPGTGNSDSASGHGRARSAAAAGGGRGIWCCRAGRKMVGDEILFTVTLSLTGGVGHGLTLSLTGGVGYIFASWQ